MKSVTVLGSTGSIGTQTLEIIRSNRDKFEVAGLSCGFNAGVFADQILEFKPKLAACGDRNTAEKVRDILRDTEMKDMTILYGDEGISDVAKCESDIVLNALMGMRGLIPTLSAIETGHDIALANKETLVSGGSIVMEAARKKGVKILPVDSEHSAIFQCIEGNPGKEIKRILLTASGGPFRGWTSEELNKVTPEMALKHPNWSMGKKITIDSATMMNKGLEIIEAMHLFDVPASKIKVLVHPQSIMHSGVEFMDTAVLAELGTPDMRVPIAVALGYPDRIDLASDGLESLDFFGKGSSLTFEEPDLDVFKCLSIAIKAAEAGGVIPAIMNGANEILVDLFLNSKIGFLDIPNTIELVVSEGHTTWGSVKNPSLKDVLDADRWARNRVMEIIEEGDYKC